MVKWFVVFGVIKKAYTTNFPLSTILTARILLYVGWRKIKHVSIFRKKFLLIKGKVFLAAYVYVFFCF